MSHDQVFEALTREFRLVVDSFTNLVTWCDARARDLGIAPETDFASLAVEGCEEKCRSLVTSASGDPRKGWECALVLHGRPITVVFSAARCADHEVALIGSLVSQDYADAVAEASKAFHEIVGLNRELAVQKTRLEDSNRAIKALHAELEQSADRLRTSAEIKGRLVASVSHEFRTPLHSILGLTGLLLGESDGPLVPEQRKQLAFVRESATERSAMINDMLDLAKLDAGNAPVRIQTFDLREFLSALSGTMRPLLQPGVPVELIFDVAPDVTLETDHGKLSQILRNLIANAIKFTERGEVRVSATVDDDRLSLTVKDTGVGIDATHLQRIFDEFYQVEDKQPKHARGSGLGLPLAKKLADLLGGHLGVESTPGIGSTFTLSIPMEHSQVGRFRRLEVAAREPDPQKAPVLVVEDDRATVFVYEQYLAMAGFQVMPARTIAAARNAVRTVRPAAILLDIMLEGEDSWNFLAELKRDEATRDIPVLVCTVMNRESRARALGADEFWFKPVDEEKLIRRLQAIAVGRGAKVLVIDDEPAARYLVQKFLAKTPFELQEAADGHAGVELARSWRPDIILLDFLLDQMTAFDVLDELKADPRTRQIPVIIVTSQVLPFDDRRRLAEQTEAIISKENLSRELAIHRIRDALRNAGIRETTIEK